MNEIKIPLNVRSSIEHALLIIGLSVFSFLSLLAMPAFAEPQSGQNPAVCYSSSDGTTATSTAACATLAANGRSRPVFQNSSGKTVGLSALVDGDCYLEVTAHTYKQQAASKCNTLAQQAAAATRAANPTTGSSIPVVADKAQSSCSDVKNYCGLIKKYADPFIKLLTVVILVGATIGLIISGILYSMAGGDPGKVSRAKMRIVQIIIGLAAYFLFTTLLRLLLPGGV